jgi:DNA-binding response OmpR family regulator
MKTVLVVEDDRSLARLVQINLDAAGYRVLLFHEGSAALDALCGATPDLVLLDLKLPGTVSGWGLLAFARQDERLHHVPVIVLSAYAQKQDMAQAKAIGATDYLVKPFGIAELMACVQRYTRADS